MHDHNDSTSRARAAIETANWDGLCRILGLRHWQTSDPLNWNDVSVWFGAASGLLGGNSQRFQAGDEHLQKARHIAAEIIGTSREEEVILFAEAGPDRSDFSAFTTAFRRLPQDAYLDSVPARFARWLLGQPAPASTMPSGGYFRIAIREIRLGRFPLTAQNFEAYGLFAFEHGGMGTAEGARVLWGRFSMQTGHGSVVSDAALRDLAVLAVKRRAVPE